MQQLMKTGLLVVLAAALGACGMTAKGLQDDPGYAPMVYPHWWEADREVSLSLGPGLLETFSWAMDGEDPAFAEVLQQLKGLRIRVYRAEDSRGGESLDRYVLQSGKRLEKQGWSRVVSVNEPGSRVLVLIKPGVEVIDGMVVLTADETEAVFVNLIGSMGPVFFDEMIGRAQSGGLSKDFSTAL